MSDRIAAVLAGVVRAGTAYLKPARRTMTRALVCEKLVPRVTVPLPDGEIVFACPTKRSAHDPNAFYTNEPETLRWIDTLPEGAVLWDIGANVGLYSLYAARHRRCRVIAFEPSAASYAVLCENLHRNRLDARVEAYCLALAGETRLDRLYMSDAAAGGSMHAFGKSENLLGAIQQPVTQAVPGFTIDRFIEIFGPPAPDHVKLDVDSIEAEIIAGGAETLRRYTKSVLVEYDPQATAAGPPIAAALQSLGFIEDKAFARHDDRRNVLFRRE